MKLEKEKLSEKKQYESNGLTITFNNSPKNGIMSPFEHTHEDYEVIIILYPVWLKIKDKTFLAEAGYCYCIQSGFTHGIIKPFKGVYYISLRWKKSVFESLINKYYGCNNFRFNTKFAFSNSLYYLINYYIELLKNNGKDKFDKVQKAIDLITVETFDHIAQSKKIKRVEHSFSSSKLTTALKYINENYNKKINIDSLAKICNLSNFYFARSFKEYTNFSPMEYVRKVRVAKAVNYITNTTLTIGVISKLTGFKTQSRLYEAIKKEFGLTPTQLKDKKNLENIVYTKN